MAENEEELTRAILRLNERAWGVALGLLFGLGLFLATIVLVVKGGNDVGQHLALLGNYFPGYRVTLLGGMIGFVYAFVIGYVLGRVVGATYNLLVKSAD